MKFRPSAYLPLTPAMLQILLALADGDKHGYAILKEVSRRSGGAIALRTGTLYTALRRFVDDGLVAETDERPDIDLDDERRRYYRLTDRGRAVALAETERLEETVRQARTKLSPLRLRRSKA
jgi:DNA-binding PadR family transcriptional regulator